MTTRERKGGWAVRKHESDDHGLVFKTLGMVLVERAQIEAARIETATADHLGAERPCHFRVEARVGGRSATLLVRMAPERGSYACWTIQRDASEYFAFLHSFGGFEA